MNHERPATRPPQYTLAVKKLSLTFWIAAPLSLAAFGLGVSFVLSGIRIQSGFEHEQANALATVQCDLSKPGEYDVPVKVVYPHGHGFKILVDGPAQKPGRYQPEPWLDGLAGEVGVVSGPFGRGHPVTLRDESVSFVSGPDSRAIARVYDSTRGDYTLHLTITHGAPALTGVPHRLVIYNDVCGCELMGVLIGNVIAAALGVVGLVLGGVAIVYRRPKVAA